MNRRMIESLIKAGAMDSLDGTRAQLTAAIDRRHGNRQRAWRDRGAGQAGLFGFVAEEEGHAEQPLLELPDWTMPQKLTGEKEMLGFYVTGHPLDQYTDKVAELATHTTDNLEGLEKGTAVALCGILTGIARKRNREGKLCGHAHRGSRGTLEAMVFSTATTR